MRKKIVIGNWKLHYTVPESTVLIEKLKKDLKPVKKTDVVVCPSFIDIYPASIEVKGANLELGAQNLFYEEVGAYTGEVSPVALSHFVKYAIVGHSERRTHFGENDKMVARKAEAAFANGIIPIICVGETLHENGDGLSKVVVVSQTETAISHLTAEEISQIVIAYEPVWAIGTDKTCSVKDAEKMVDNIRNLVKAIYGEKTAEAVRIVYGGSVDEENVKKFAASKKIDGLLVGRASVDEKKFAMIVKEVEKTAPTVTKKVKVKK